MISPLAYVDPEAQLGKNVEVGPFACIEKGVSSAITASLSRTPVFSKVPLWEAETLSTKTQS